MLIEIVHPVYYILLIKNFLGSFSDILDFIFLIYRLHILFFAYLRFLITSLASLAFFSTAPHRPVIGCIE